MGSDHDTPQEGNDEYPVQSLHQEDECTWETFEEGVGHGYEDDSNETVHPQPSD